MVQEFTSLERSIPYQFREVDARKINPSKPDSLRLYTLDDISTSQFCTELIVFLPLIKDILDSIYKPLTFCKWSYVLGIPYGQKFQFLFHLVM
jgi:hypothetical protein